MSSRPANFALHVNRYLHESPATREHLAMVAVKNHHHGVSNPKAQLRFEITIEDVLNAPIVVEPFGLYDCTPQSDGAAALLLVGEEVVDRYTDRPVWVRGVGLGLDRVMHQHKADMTTFPPTVKAARQAYAMAGVGPDDIDVAEVHDCFTGVELIDYEDLGFCDRFGGAALIESGETAVGGRLPVNPSGGLKAKGHPPGATGIAQCVELFEQLRGESTNQVDGARVALAHNIGGPTAVSAVTILELEQGLRSTVEYINVEIDARVATVTFDRPPVNALNAQAFREIEQAFTELRHGTDAHVAIFTAAGERVFCGGVDLNDSARRHGREQADDDSIVDLLDPGSIVRDCFWALSDCPLPVIGAINGAAVGAGLALVACCDVIIASEHARFALPEINAGVLGGGRHLQRMVGPYKTRKMFYTGEFVGAEEFHRLGAVEKVVARRRSHGRSTRARRRHRDQEPDRSAPGQGVVEPGRGPRAQGGLPTRAGLHRPHHPLPGLRRGTARLPGEARPGMDLDLNQHQRATVTVPPSTCADERAEDVAERLDDLLFRERELVHPPVRPVAVDHDEDRETEACRVVVGIGLLAGEALQDLAEPARVHQPGAHPRLRQRVVAVGRLAPHEHERAVVVEEPQVDADDLVDVVGRPRRLERAHLVHRAVERARRCRCRASRAGRASTGSRCRRRRGTRPPLRRSPPRWCRSSPWQGTRRGRVP